MSKSSNAIKKIFKILQDDLEFDPETCLLVFMTKSGRICSNAADNKQLRTSLIELALQVEDEDMAINLMPPEN